MSNGYYNELWLVTEKDMERLLELDQMIQSTTSPKSKDAALNTILPVYLKYRELVQRLIICHDQMIQPQKRKLIKQVLDCTIGRMLEYNREIVGLESNDYAWPDDLMIKQKMTPDDVKIPVSMSYTADRKDVLQQRRKYIEDLIDNAEKSAAPAVEEATSDIEQVEVRAPSIMNALIASRSTIIPKRGPRSIRSSRIHAHLEALEAKKLKDAQEIARKAFEDAIRIIQSHERARTARYNGALAERLYNRRNKFALGEYEKKTYSAKIKNKAATVIQRHWRGFIVRKSLQRRLNEIDELLHLTVPSWKDKSVFQKDEENYQRRISLQPEALSAMEEVINKERTKVFRIRGPGLMEDITDEIREWFLMWYNELGYFDAYPVTEVGGTVLVATGQTLTPDEYLVEKMKEGANEAKKGGLAKDDKKNKADEKKKSATKTGKGKLKKDGWTMPKGSKALNGLVLGKDEFVKNWSLMDENNHNRQQVYLDIINEKLYYELQLEMREVVDELMRLELAKFNAALMKDHAGDNPKFINPTLAKSKKSKKKKKKKKKGKKDPLAALPIEDIFNELVLAKIIHNYPEEHLENWQGDLSYQNYEAQLQLREFQQRSGEIRDSVMKYCILPLGSREIHANAPLVRSVCICGLPRHGKSFLANAICTEVGALLFDLTPSVLVGQYEGKKNEEMLMKMIGKIARVYPPSIIFIDGGEKPWLKKIPPAENYTQPKRFAKLLPKFVKAIKPGDQILFLTLATEPYKAAKAFVKIHDKFIIIPITDYSTIYMFYKKLLMNYHGIDRNFDVSCLARVSVGYPLEIIREAIEKVMNIHRIITLKFKPLDPQEIYKVLLTYKLPSPKIVERFKNFETRKTPLGRNRAKMLAALKNAGNATPRRKRK